MSLNNTAVAPNVDHEYEITIVRFFTIMAVFWGIVGMTVGVFIASQLAWPALNFDTSWLSFGRLRPLHTNAVIFAFGGSALLQHHITSYSALVRHVCSHPIWHGLPFGVGKRLLWLLCLHCHWV